MVAGGISLSLPGGYHYPGLGGGTCPVLGTPAQDHGQDLRQDQ